VFRDDREIVGKLHCCKLEKTYRNL